MPRPPIAAFYYNPVKNATAYQKQPPGELVFTRWIRGLDAWRSPGLVRAMKPKKLILTGAEVSFPFYEQVELREVYLDLITQGFSLYCLKDGELTLITKDNINDIFYADKIDNFNEWAEANTKSLNLSEDELYGIEKQTIDVLLGKVGGEKNTFTLQELLDLSVQKQNWKTLI